MKATLVALLLVSFTGFADGAVIPSSIDPKAATVYIVTRSATAEARALFSSRLAQLHATNLVWYEGASVVRADVPADALIKIQADRDVLVVLAADSPANDPAPPGSAQKAAWQHGIVGPVLDPEPAAALAPLITVPQAAPIIATQANMMAGYQPAGMNMMMPQMGMGGMGMGTGMQGAMGGLPMGATGLVDSLAGGMAMHFLNRTPSCKITVSKSSAKFSAAGGEGTFDVKASGSCAWQAQASVDWIEIASGTGTSGSGVVAYSVKPGSGKSRSASICITATAGGSPIKGSASQVVVQSAK